MSLSDLVSAAVEADGQQAYEAACRAVFAELDRLEDVLSGQRYLDAERGPADEAVFGVLVQFDAVHYGLHKLNLRRIADYPNLSNYLRDLFQQTPTDVKALQIAAYADRRRNPPGTVPRDVPDLWAPHDRWRFGTGELRSVGTEESGAVRFQGEFVRGRSGFREWLGQPERPVVAGRYHLYLAANCPWCHRVALTVGIKGLSDVVGVDFTWYRRDPEGGWQFRPDLDGFGPDRVNGVRFVKELYQRLGSSEKSVPVLWDVERGDIVNNESAEIIRMLDDAWPDRGPRLSPPDRIPAIDAVNAWVWRDINNGAYKAGFTSSQDAYEVAFDRYFAALDRVDAILRRQDWLCGDAPTEADVRLFPTLFRHDHVYYTRMKLNRKRVREYPGIRRWLAAFWALPGVPEWSDLDQCIRGYFGRHGDELVPLGPDLSFPP